MIGMIALIILAVSAFAPAASQAAGRSTTQTRGVYWFDPHYVGDDITDTYVYDDALLTGDSRPYDPQRATMTYELAVASISSERTGDYALKSQNLRAYLEDNGFVDFDYNFHPGEKGKAWAAGSSKSMMYVPTFMTYSGYILGNHSTELDLAWARNYDNYYTNERTEYKVVTDGYTVQEPAAAAIGRQGTDRCAGEQLLHTGAGHGRRQQMLLSQV